MSLDQDTVILFATFVVPGLVSMSVYRVIMPARSVQWGDALVQGLFYSVINFVLLLPLLFLLGEAQFRSESPWITWLMAIVALILAPALWPFLLRAIYKSDWFSKKAQIPYPTAWDYIFDLRDPTFVLVHLRSGSLLGGYWGSNSYAGSFPNNGDIYLEAVYEVDKDGKFGEPFEATNGVLLRRDEYAYIELFKVPEAGGNDA